MLFTFVRRSFSYVKRSFFFQSQICWMTQLCIFRRPCTIHGDLGKFECVCVCEQTAETVSGGLRSRRRLRKNWGSWRVQQWVVVVILRLMGADFQQIFSGWVVGSEDEEGVGAEKEEGVKRIHEFVSLRAVHFPCPVLQLTFSWVPHNNLTTWRKGYKADLCSKLLTHFWDTY